MNVYVARHGETNLNKEKRLQGRNGEPLNENGIKQAEQLAKKLENIKFDMVISSPQTRAIQTAEIITNVKPIIDNRIDVFDLGEADRIKKEEVEMIGFLPNPTKYKGVESFENFVYRIKDFMKSIEELENRDSKNILIVGHKCTVGGIDAYFNNFTNLKESMKNASSNGEFKVYNLNN